MAHKPLYAVFGATGNIGKVIAEELLKSGMGVRVIGRSAEKLERFKKMGADICEGNIQQASFIEQAVHKCQAAFLMIPPDMSITKGFRDFQRNVGRNMALAAHKAKLSHVIALSSIGAHLSSGNGPVAGLYDFEKSCEQQLKGSHVLYLRPGFFMENMLGSMSMIKHMNIYGSTARADLPMTLIATQDIGHAAARSLLELNFTGHQVRELLGPRDITMQECTKILGKVIGKPDLPYVQFPEEEAMKGMVNAGVPEERAQMYLELYRGFNNGTVKPTQERSLKTNTPTTFEAFAEKVFAPAYRSL